MKPEVGKYPPPNGWRRGLDPIFPMAWRLPAMSAGLLLSSLVLGAAALLAGAVLLLPIALLALPVLLGWQRLRRLRSR